MFSLLKKQCPWPFCQIVSCLNYKSTFTGDLGYRRCLLRSDLKNDNAAIAHQPAQLRYHDTVIIKAVLACKQSLARFKFAHLPVKRKACFDIGRVAKNQIELAKAL